MNKSKMQIQVKSIVWHTVRDKGYVSPLDVLLQLGKVTPKQVEDWRFGRIPYLEQVANGGLGLLSRIQSELRKVAQEMELMPSPTVYKTWGKGPKRLLRFSKTGDSNVERHYATHFVGTRLRAEAAERAESDSAAPAEEAAPPAEDTADACSPTFQPNISI